MPEWIDPMAVTGADGAPGRARWAGNGRRGDRWGTLIRHAAATVPLAIRSLAKEVSLFAWLRALIAAVGRTPLLPPSFRSAGLAAIALTPVATAAHEKESVTAGATTEARPERSFRRGRFRRLDFALHLITIHRIADDRTDDCAFGADDVALLRREFRKRRFQMIDDIGKARISEEAGNARGAKGPY